MRCWISLAYCEDPCNGDVSSSEGLQAEQGVVDRAKSRAGNQNHREAEVSDQINHQILRTNRNENAPSSFDDQGSVDLAELGLNPLRIDVNAC